LGGLQAEAGLLSYRDTSIKMMIILPDEGVSLANIEKNLTVKVVTDLLNAMWRYHCEKVSLPRFKVSMKHDLKSMITSLGGGEMFDDMKANFSGISERPLVLSEAIQKAVIEVTEEGTIAAAATSIKIIPRSGRLGPAPSLIVNRPFLYLLVKPEAKKGKPPVILFIGSVRDPMFDEEVNLKPYNGQLNSSGGAPMPLSICHVGYLFLLLILIIHIPI